ncbi:hypothetical protein L210DRAFT_3657362 [Boletus edulis BED1]|uniref:Uncharacterized protein n=1 Tax=Boletus edulis BED1 TaxID=1328754 RepID=A0AAD4BBE1_BOLED|nr:hypothetical protein L210DRAFT_3657362 [Boletus edulis BED1]
MGRLKLYMNPQEKVLAARRYRAKYYAKNRTMINTQRRVAHSKGNEVIKQPIQPLGEPSSKNRMLIRRPGRPKGTKNCTAARINDSESAIEGSLKSIIGSSSRQKIQALCDRFIDSGNYREIYSTLSAVEELDTRLRKLTTIHLRNGGSDSISESATQTSIHAVIKALEDLLVNAMEGVNKSYY